PLRRHTGVVDQQINSTKLVDDCLDHLLVVFEDGNIALHGQAGSAKFFDPLLDFKNSVVIVLWIQDSSAAGNVIPASGKLDCNPAADAAARSGYKSNWAPLVQRSRLRGFFPIS